jgi:hypothetical protein
MSILSNTETKKLVARMIARGLVVIPVVIQRPVSTPERRRQQTREAQKRYRARRIAEGLTVTGKVRVRRRWPTLRGLDRKTYRQRYHLLTKQAA